MLNLKHPGVRIAGACAAWLLLTAAVAPKIDWNTQIKNKPATYPQNLLVDARMYNYAPQTPNVGLAAGTPASVTLTPCPLGVTATDTRLRFWISGGAGTAESVASTGSGTCTSGAATGSVAFTPANSHSGAWTISSSHAGIYEAIAGNPFKKIYIPTGRYTMRDCLTLPNTGGIWLKGDNYDFNFAGGSILDYSAVANSCGSAIQVLAGSSLNTYNIEDLQLWGAEGTGIVAGAPQAGIKFVGSVRVTLSHVQVQAFYQGVWTSGAFEVTIKDKSLINYNVCQGFITTGIINLLRISDSYFDYNGRISAGGCGPGLYIVADAPPNQSTTVLLDGVESAGNGTAPFGGQTITSAPGIYAGNVSGWHMTNSYIESNVGPAQVQYLGGMSAITEINNQFFPALASSTSAITYASDTTAVTSFGNTFYGLTSVRAGLPASLASFVIGPDFCLSTSPECTNHPQLAGVPTLASYTFATLPVKPNGTQLYCSDCNATCTAGGGTGRTCFRENSAWVH